jgi:hypothetical protein
MLPFIGACIKDASKIVEFGSLAPNIGVFVFEEKIY